MRNSLFSCRMKANELRLIYPYVIFAFILLLSSCSTTSRLPDDEYLYTGIKSINYVGKQGTDAEETAIGEVEGALSYSPNNSFFGSSKIRTPLPIGLWIYNSMDADSLRGIKKWFYNTFAATPKTISSVAPETRAKVATNLLQNYGYFQGNVGYELHTNTKNPKKQKISYDVYLGHAYTYDSIRYGFPAFEDSIIRATEALSYLHRGKQFSVPDLQSERNRISNEFRKNGFYYYRPDYINYYADSINVPGKIKMLVVPDKQMPAKATRQWRFGNLSVFLRSNTATQGTRRMNAYDDTLHLHHLQFAYQGKKVPIHPRIMLRNIKFRPGMMYNSEIVSSTISELQNMDCLSSPIFTFTPRDTTDTCSVLDVRLDATMDKLIDAEFDLNFTQKSNSQIGPDASVTLSRRNAFRHGEKLALTLRGSYYWQVRGRSENEINNLDSYDYGADLSLSYPWLVFPGFLKQRYHRPTSTAFTASFTRTNIARAYRYNQFSLGVEYTFKTSDYITHTFSPLKVEIIDVRSINLGEDIVGENSVYNRRMLSLLLSDKFIPSIQYTFNYNNSSDNSRKVTTNFQASVKESGNIVSGIYAIFGRGFNESGKKILSKEYSQFIKAHVELRNRYKITTKSSFATRFLLGVIWPYGNSITYPISEAFYSGGPNSIRAFPSRSLGPGHTVYSKDDMYLAHAGSFRLEANAEYRFPLFGNLYGALFLDAGNVWDLQNYGLSEAEMKEYDIYFGTLKWKDFLDEIALGTGFGFRYDLDFLVIRIDFGVAIHAPYDTGKSGYYNIRRFFKDGVGINFAVGYPF